MINIVLWVFFGIVIISQLNYCSGDEVVPVSLEIINTTINTNTTTSTIECSVTQDPIEISKGELIKLKVTSPLLVHYKLCRFDDVDLETTIKQIPKVNTDKKNGRHHNNFELYVREAGIWSCKFYIHKGTNVVKPTETIVNDVYTVATCNITIIINESIIQNVESMLVGVGIGLSWLIIPVILGIVYCVKRRARPVHDLKSLSAMQRPKHDRARYSGAPLKKPLIMELTERESGIYEALETIQDVAKKMDNTDAIPATASNTNSSIDREGKAKSKDKFKLNNVRSMFGLARRGQKTAQNEDTNDGIVRFDSDGSTKDNQKQAKDKRNTLDRIKERPPHPLPIPPSEDSEEEYEAMSPDLPVRTPEPSRMKPPIPPPKSPKASKHELKAALKKKLPTPPTKPMEKLPKPIPAPPMQKKTLKSPLVGNPDTVSELQSVLKKKGIATVKPVPPSPAAKPPQATLPKASGPKLQPAPSMTRRPSKPWPMDAPVPPPISTLPRPQPSVPVKEPEEDDCEWDGEDWTYEPLPSHNIYNM